MSSTHPQDLEKTAWVYKNVKEDDLIIENVEMIMNFNEKQKFEINLNRHYSKLYIKNILFFSNFDLENILEYTPEKNVVKEISEEGFQIGRILITNNFLILFLLSVLIYLIILQFLFNNRLFTCHDRRNI